MGGGGVGLGFIWVRAMMVESMVMLLVVMAAPLEWRRKENKNTWDKTKERKMKKMISFYLIYVSLFFNKNNVDADKNFCFKYQKNTILNLYDT